MTHTTIERRSRVLTLLVAAAVATPGAAWAQAPSLGSAGSFGVLGGTAVNNTGATVVAGDVGVFPGPAIAGFPPGTITPGSALHQADAVAAQAQQDAQEAYDDLETRTCAPANNLSGQDLGGKNLVSGVYCFDAAAQLSGTLTLTGAGPWIFQVAGAFTSTAASSVVVPAVTTACKGSNVSWQIGGATTTLGPTTAFVGSILALNTVTAGAGATIDGRAVSLDAGVTLASATVNGCLAGRLLPLSGIKVTGGGQISVPSPNSTDPDATGAGRANYGFNATPGGAGAPASGHLNYLNHVDPRLHINGPATAVNVIALNPDGTPERARFSGTCDIGTGCTYSVTVEDNGEPGRDDRFGITVVSNGAVIESRSDRTILHGNLQFHAGLRTDLDAARFAAGQVMTVRASLSAGSIGTPVDAYVVVRLPDGSYMSWTGASLVPGLVPIVRNMGPVNFSGIVAQFTIPAGTPAGTYAWMTALTEPGTLSLASGVSETRFTIAP